MFEQFKLLPPDPILGLSAAVREDTNPNKVDLGVGVYKNEAGATPVMQAVRLAEAGHLAAQSSKSYLAPAGDPSVNQAMAELLFGAGHSAMSGGRVRLLQTPGGCGGLRLAAELVKRCNSNATVWVSDPTWANHIPLFGSAGLQIKQYPYYDYSSHSVRFDQMMACLQQVGAGDLVLLHGCCHNPSGADLSEAQWQSVTALAQKNGFTPLIDLAYQGLGRGLEPDVYGVRLMAASVPEMLLVASCSKNFGLYRERCGALALLGSNSVQADATLSQALSAARGNYSMPPSHGAAIVGAILQNKELDMLWRDELEGMRVRMNELRQLLVDKLEERGVADNFQHIRHQYGMFSFLGVTPPQLQRLREQYSVYMVDSSRINIAGISHTNIEYLADAIAAVL